jgi:signal transduction histidine kinase
MSVLGEADEITGPPAGPPKHLRPGAAGFDRAPVAVVQELSVEQALHECRQLHQAINGLALELDASDQTDGSESLKQCVADVVVGAISEFSHQGKLLDDDQEVPAAHHRIGFLAQELRKHITTATVALRLIQSNKIGFSAALSGVLDRSLMGLRTLAYPFLSQVRVAPGMAMPHQTLSVADLFAELVRVMSVEAQSRGCRFRAPAVSAGLAVRGDRDLLLAAIKNLLQNAFKFTRYGTDVVLTAIEVGEHVHIEVQSHCGGLAPGSLEDLFRPFTPLGHERPGLDLGLSISAPDLQASHGTLSVRDLPGSGCIFCIRLPRLAAGWPLT